ncbi:TetR/AcrR family transcriptional regulator (plasmid) [Pseudarthrobacter sp. P1]|uniref:TetR/AcrR family transcriptional regulator n=1 Tax=Pseudarthrobacter sp. P1 TaxID=3418418 RepID=UPI003CEC25E2
MPTGVSLRDPRAQLFAAAERVLVRKGPSALTSRAVTEEAEVAKGVLHRHFTDFDSFVSELVRNHISELATEIAGLSEAAGTGSITVNLIEAFGRIFTPVNLGLVSLVITQDGLRSKLRSTTPSGIPILTEAAKALSAYLAAERHLGRIAPQTDADTIALTLIGTGHLLIAGEASFPPAFTALQQAVESIINSAGSVHPAPPLPPAGRQLG